MHKTTGVACPHLEWEGEVATCKIHHLDWYVETPCFSHTQIERKDSPCRTGEYLLKKGINFKERLSEGKTCQRK